MTRQNSFRLSRHWCWRRSRCQRTMNRGRRLAWRFRIRNVSRRRIPWSPIEARERDSIDLVRGGSRIMAENPYAANTPPAKGAAATPYVGSGAVGTSKAAASAGVAAVGPEDNVVNQRRRRLVWVSVTAFLTAWFLAFFRFFLPRTLFEPATVFKIGYPSDYGLGVDTKWQQKYRIWVDRRPDRIFVIYARCTHLGCTPDWKASENKFKCPCHGSGYDDEGINFEGPAPRPMDRAFVQLAPDGEIIVDTSRLYQWPKGQPSRFNEPGAYLPT